MKRRSLGLALFVAFGFATAWADDIGSIAIDFSHCGYSASSERLPNVEARLFVNHVQGDATALLQAAIDHLATLPQDDQGFRGALLLDNGDFEIAGQLKIRASGIVLRGSGETTLRAMGPDRRAVIRVFGKSDAQLEETERQVASEVSVGGVDIALEFVSGLQSGDTVFVTRPSTKEWIEAIGMDRFLVGWRPGSRDLQWERRILAITGKVITVDAPITSALEQRYGGGVVQKLVQWPGRIENVGIENLTLLSAVASKNTKDEDHAWTGISMENVRDAWVRQVDFLQFAGSAVMLWETTKNVSVVDCQSRKPISELGGYRRDAFFTMGQQTLFLRCWSEHAMRDFTVGHAAAGPNAFVACDSYESFGDSGSIGSWASGILYDNVNIEGGDLRLENQWVANHAAGWSAANSVLWQCTAAEIHCENPPTASNDAVGMWGRYFGDGNFRNEDEFVSPTSLFQGLLAKRSSIDVGPIGRKHFGATNPSIEKAAEFVQASNSPQRSLRKIIEEASTRETIPVDAADIPVFTHTPSKESPKPIKALRIVDGTLRIAGEPTQGKRMSVPWWRGNLRPNEAPKMGPAITRFVPGRVGLGFTDDLQAVAQFMIENGQAALDHNHGLWYDRRRDDHTRVRRADGNVCSPFYEQPFARSGEGTAWDGLSKYDLEKPNPWYWNRLKQFADIADTEGLLLYHQFYFQHNFLEAGAHWSDCPWRSANNINQTGFPEPPPYMSDKRIFQAHLVYNVNHPVRRALHRQYIRQGLTNFADNHNVIHHIGAEYTGPLTFMQFWIDTIIEWERETGNDALIALSCTKDVQDAILADPQRTTAVEIIDINYWTYLADGKLYAPEGGKNLAPRQHRRQGGSGKVSKDSIERSIEEYRQKFPDKAVLYEGVQY